MNRILIKRLRNMETFCVRAELVNLEPDSFEWKMYLLATVNAILEIADETSEDYPIVYEEIVRLVEATKDHCRGLWAMHDLP